MRKFYLDGLAGQLECVLHLPESTACGIALIAHPHPLFGGTMDNKVVQTLAKTFTQLGYYAARMNFRGVGNSEGEFDHGEGETEDMLILAEHLRRELGELPFTLAGFSFGAFVQTRVLSRLKPAPEKLVLVAPAVSRFQVAAVPENTLVIHGEADDVVPLADLLNWARPQELPVVVVPGADHFFHRRLHLISQLVTQACRVC